MSDPFDWLFALEQFGIKFGLDNIRALAAALQHPERSYPTVHIAGTNGKGSVTAMVDAALRAAGHRSARYTSPHLVDLTERFVVDGRAVTTDALAAAIRDVRRVVDDLRARGTLDVQPTFFEVTTAVAFELFRRASVDVAVIEVGLGGRLDATNIVEPLATAITSIGFDHQLYLGHTLREIAAEKAGIIKPHVPVVVGPMDADAAAAIEAIATSRHADIRRVAADDSTGFTVALAGDHQRANAAVAIALLREIDARGLRVAPDAVASGLARPQWPGRLERRQFPDGRELLLDAAHNPAGAAALASYLRASEPRPLVFGAMRDKAAAEMLELLLPAVAALVVTRPSNPRAAEPRDLAATARRVGPPLPIVEEPSVGAALARAWTLSPRIVAAGSIFLLGDVLKAVGGS